jgi:hypothetical protein
MVAIPFELVISGSSVNESGSTMLVFQTTAAALLIAW